MRRFCSGLGHQKVECGNEDRVWLGSRGRTANKLTRVVATKAIKGQFRVSRTIFFLFFEITQNNKQNERTRSISRKKTIGVNRRGKEYTLRSQTHGFILELVQKPINKEIISVWNQMIQTLEMLMGHGN